MVPKIEFENQVVIVMKIISNLFLTTLLIIFRRLLIIFTIIGLVFLVIDFGVEKTYVVMNF